MMGGRSDARTPRARGLRHEATPQERMLWVQLRQAELPGGHFRRQAPIGPYFADFAHHGLRLVVELDGSQHGLEAGLRSDATRTSYLEAAGYRVLRFWNHEVASNLDGVVETILAAAAERPLTPGLHSAPARPSPPLAGGGRAATRFASAPAAFALLADHAARRRSIAYADFADRLGLGSARQLGWLLNPLLEWCRERRLPPLPIIVVRREDRLPSGGYNLRTVAAETARVFDHPWAGEIPPTADDLSRFALPRLPGGLRNATT